MDFCDINPFVRNIIYISSPVWEHYLRRGTDCRMFFVSQGSFSIYLKENENEILKGGLVYIPAGCEYALVKNSDDFCCYVANFDFTQDYKNRKRPFFPKSSAEFKKNEAIFAPHINGGGFFEDCAVLKHATFFEEMFEELCKTFSDKRLMYDCESSAYMKRIISCFAERIMTDTKSSKEKIAAEAIAYIKKNYQSSNLSNDEISSHLGYNSFYVNKLVKLFTGKSMHKYLLLHRLMRAENLLLYSDNTISDIANLCGFSEYDVFYSAFKKEYGLSPSKLREETKKIHL